MPIAVGDSVGSFKILSQLGRGGMGEVFRARDSRLGRDVALKCLRVDWASDPLARGRFEREARAIAALTHPHIGALYDVGEHDGSPYLVMECVEGETLADRLTRRPLSVDEATRVGAAIAEALAFAHRSGIVHRDLKPANVMLTKTGVKLIDFGLASMYRADDADSATAIQTEPHAILGTVPYMSPEQLTAGVVDARTDIFAFGAVLFEMVAGRRLFDGASGAQITSAILRDEPPRVEPPALDRVMRRCLAKDADQRWQSILDVGTQLAWVAESTVEQRSASRWWIAIGAGVAVIAAVAMVVWLDGLFRFSGEPAVGPAPPAESAHAAIILGRGQQFFVNSRPNLAISDDGKVVAVSAREDGVQHLFVRRFNQPVAVRIDRATSPLTPFFSPDGKWIGFASEGKLRKVAVNGGQVVPIADASDINGAVWLPSGDIVFAPTSGGALWSVPSAGGTPRQLTQLDNAAGETSHRWPFILPDGRVGFATSSSGASSLAAIDAAGTRGALLENATWGTYVPGRLLFSRRRQLFVVATEAGGNPIDQPPIPVAEVPLMNGTGVPFMAVAATGDMIYLPAESDEGERSLLLVDQTGRVEPLAASARAYQFPTVAPDGRRVAVTIRNGNDTNVWLYDLARRALTPLTTDGKSTGSFAWSPDSRELMFSSAVTGPLNVRRLKIDAPGLSEAVLSGPRSRWASSWLRDGRVTFMQFSPGTMGDVLLFDPADRSETTLVAQPPTEWSGRVSADGQWIAYVSNESGRFEAMVARLSEPGRRWQVSLGGGHEVVWSRQGLELYYRTDLDVMATKINPNVDPPIGAVRRLFENRYLYEPSGPGLANYDVLPDGRFLMIATDDDPNALTLRVVFNWSAGSLPGASSQ